jgi:hypothetical protein
MKRDQETLMKYAVSNLMALGIVVLGVAICAGAIYVGDTDDAPGASLAGLLLLLGSVVLAVKIARRKA